MNNNQELTSIATILSNVDVLSVGIAIAGAILLGFTVYLSDQSSATGRALRNFSVATAVWGFLNFMSYRVVDSQVGLWLTRLVLSSAVFQAYTLFRLFSIFPDQHDSMSKKAHRPLRVIVITVAMLCLTPLMLQRVSEVSETGRILTIENGPGMLIFGLLAAGLVIFGIYSLVTKMQSSAVVNKKPFAWVLGGSAIMFSCIIVFNLIFPSVLRNSSYVPLGALFVLPFVAFTAYAVGKHHLFNVKAVTTAFFSGLMAVVIFAEALLSTDIVSIVLRFSIFIFVLYIGILLVSSVMREVEQREEIQKLADELQAANDRQAGLMHFITHQVKGFFTMSRNIFSLMLENTFGELPPDMRRMAQQGFENTTKGVVTVQEILNASNLQKGTVQMTMEQFDLLPLIQEILGELNPRINDKGLQLATVFSSGPIFVMGDRFQLHEVYRNLIDNAIRYTPKGTIVVKLEKKDVTAHFEVKDSGVGLSDEDKKRLFTEGGRGSESLKVNVESTGFGLFIVKGIVEQHKGKVWADSEGKGKGSTFCVDLPLLPGS